jgi:hypothetical protein
VSVLSSLGDGDGQNLAGLALDHHEAVWGAYKYKMGRWGSEMVGVRMASCVC